ncbi:MAG: hypothetical protein KatS3mg077_1657 [Candidatus Binatia bacterium]|nr:MAG: hypothetical protein KatS3mg077_1657 [Candidatus Binatia bacterium]
MLVESWPRPRWRATARRAPLARRSSMARVAGGMGFPHDSGGACDCASHFRQCRGGGRKQWYVMVRRVHQTAGCTGRCRVGSSNLGGARVYYPDEGASQTNNDRSATFQLQNGVAVYGGFLGTEGSLAQRDPSNNVTVLSGDIDQNDTTDSNGVVASYADIAGNNSYQVVTGSGTNASAVVDGFTVTGGRANGPIGPCAQICGAGMFNDNGSPTVANVTFSGNFSDNAGGGMANVNGASPTVENARFVGNRAGQGGGMANLDGSSPAISRSSFASNLARVGTGGNGGGMFNLNGSTPRLAGVVFWANEALVNGGGVFNQTNSAAIFENVGFFGNKAGFGGGLYNLASSNAQLVNGVFSGNVAFRTGGGAGGGMLNNNSAPTLTNVTLSGNVAAGDIQEGGGILNGNGSAPALVNVILWGNVATTGAEMRNSGGSIPQISFSIVRGSGGSGSGWVGSFGTDGGGNLDVDPLFVDAGGADNVQGTPDDDLQLTSGSPAIDAGNNTAAGPAGVTADYAGSPRFLEDPLKPDAGLGSPPVVDLGAYEFRRLPLAPVPVQSLPWLLACVLLFVALGYRRLSTAAAGYLPREKRWHQLPDNPGSSLGVGGSD